MLRSVLSLSSRSTPRCIRQVQPLRNVRFNSTTATATVEEVNDTATTTTTTANDSHAEVSVEEMLALLKKRNLDDPEVQKLEMSPEIEKELSDLFNQTIREFALEPDLSSEIIKLVERGLVAGPRSGRTTKREPTKVNGNVRGQNAFPNVRRTDNSQGYSSQELFVRQLFHRNVSARLGANVENVYKPHLDTLAPPSIRETSISTLLAAGAHLGHSRALFRPATQPYIYGERDGIHIINLDQTLIHLRRASKVVQGISEKGGLILFVGTRAGQQRSLQLAAKRAGGYYVHSRWVPGTLTNATQISSGWERIELDMGDNETDREISPNLQKTIVKPDLVVILNPVENRNAIRECISLKVPTVGIIDTDSEPSLVTYPIPANDDSLRATDLIVGVLSRAAQKGRAARVARFEAFKSAAVSEDGEAVDNV